MDVARTNKYDIALGKWMFHIAFNHRAGSFQDEYFMFVWMVMFRGMATGRDLELTHGERRCSVGLA